MMKTLFFLLIIFFNLNGISQINIQVENEGGKPLSGTLLYIDSLEHGISNRYGKIVIDRKHLDKSIQLKDIESGELISFILTKDTNIVFPEITEFESVSIYPVNAIKLHKRIYKHNQEQLPSTLNLRGEYFYLNYYTFGGNNKNSNDTIYEIIRCELTIVDVFGEPKIKCTNIEKYHSNNFDLLESNEKYAQFSKLRPCSPSLELFIQSINLNNFKVKKLKKYNSQLSSDSVSQHLTFIKNDSTKFMNIVKQNEVKYSWNKMDSIYTHFSHYNDVGVYTAKSFISTPFYSMEYSNNNRDFSNAYICNENLFLFGDASFSMANNFFSYFYITESFQSESNDQNLNPISSFTRTINEKEFNAWKENIELKLHPLKTPVYIFSPVKN